MPTTKYIWDEANYLAEADGNDAIQTVYTNEPQQYGNLVSSRIPGATSYHHFDALGSTRQLTNAAGSVTDAMIYDAWGDVINRSGTTTFALLWIGQLGYYFDSETGSFWVRARPYGPAVGRWHSVDALFIALGELPYAYAANSPTSRIDPSGALSIFIKALDNLLGDLPCPSQPQVWWQYSILPKAPCSGYLVQKVTVDCDVNRCNNVTVRDKFSYWEAWAVALGDTTVAPGVGHLGPFPFNYTDSAHCAVPNGTRGSVVQAGEVRFYC